MKDQSAVCGNDSNGLDVSLFCHDVLADLTILWRHFKNVSQLCEMRRLYLSSTSGICPDYLDLDDIFCAEMSLFNLKETICEFHNSNAKDMDAAENRFFLKLKHEITLLRSYFENIYQACDGFPISSDKKISSDYFDLDNLYSVVNSFEVLKEKTRAFFEEY
jgi:hypothetical protein